MTAGFPISLNLAGRRCLVVGGGPVALRKIEALLGAGGVVEVIAPEILEAIRGLDVTCTLRAYRDGDLAGRAVAIAATGDPRVDGAVYADGQRLGVWVNAADDPVHCDFTLPAVFRTGPVTVTVGTGGASPALSSWLRDRLGAALPGHLDTLVALVTGARSAIRAAGVATEPLAWRPLIEAVDDALPSAPEEAAALVAAFVDGAISGPVGRTGDHRGTVTA
jgi:siroheme synthase-like protein